MDVYEFQPLVNTQLRAFRDLLNCESLSEGVVSVFQEFCKGFEKKVSKVFQVSFEVVSGKFKGAYFISFSQNFQGCLK